MKHIGTKYGVNYSGTNFYEKREKHENYVRYVKYVKNASFVNMLSTRYVIPVTLH